MAVVLMQASATVWSGASWPPLWPEFTAAASHRYNVGKKRWQTFVKCSFHKAAIVGQSQHQHVNVDTGCCLPTVNGGNLQPVRELHCVCATHVSR